MDYYSPRNYRNLFLNSTNLQMKTVSHLANNLNVGINSIVAICKKERIVNCNPDGKRYIDKYQEEYIQQILIYEGKLDCFIFESKMQEMQEPEQESW